MKNLFTLLLLVVSFLAVGQTNNTTEEIKYWKSIADSNDTVAYRQYLNRYGETGLYYDEAITKITLLKTSGKQAQSKSIECRFYRSGTDYWYHYSVVRFDNGQNKVWMKQTRFDTIMSNMAVSKDFYERTAWTTNEEYEYDPMKSTSARDVYFKRYELYEIKEYVGKALIGYVYPGDFYQITAKDSRGHKFYKVIDFYKENSDFRYVIKTMQGYRYIAISKDKSSFIMWFEEDENLYGQIFEKRNYYRVPKEELLPKKVNYDFLNK